MNLLAKINWQGFSYVLLILAVLAIVFTVLIIIVNKFCKVEEDPKVATVKENLAGANCGGCGFKGCADFANALVNGKAELSACPVTDKTSKEKIATALGIDCGDTTPLMAVVKCAGGKDIAVDKFNYVGAPSCEAKNILFGGDKKCSFGCLGGGDCVASCSENGVKIDNDVAVIDSNSCIACGSCVRTCPKKIIELIPKSAKVYVACSSKCKGKEVMESCKVGCIGCGLCAKNCPENAISMVDNLPVIDYSKCSGCLTCIDKCPKKTIRKI